MLRGCDISEFQSANVDIDPYQFVMIRSSYGVGAQDKMMTKHAQRALSKDKLIGFYHYAYPAYNNPEEEAKSMLSYIAPYKDHCLIALDWEGVSLEYPSDWAFDFLDYIASKTNATPLIYMSASVAKQSQWKEIAKVYPLWVAHWGVNTPGLGQWGKYTMWQTSDSPIDQDVFNGTNPQFKDLQNKKRIQPVVKPSSSVTLNSLNNEVSKIKKTLKNIGDAIAKGL